MHRSIPNCGTVVQPCERRVAIPFSSVSSDHLCHHFFVGESFIPISQYYDRQATTRIPYNDVAESDGLAGVPEKLTGKPPAESIMDMGLVSRSMSCKGESSALIVQQARLVESGVPFRQ